MKHPAYRCSDILFVHPEYRDKAYDYLRRAVDTYLLPGMKAHFDKVQAMPEFANIKLECKVGLENVGSITFGCASLHSDWDFNFYLPDWNSQAVARQWFFAGTNRKEFEDCMMEWEREWGFPLQLGCIDPKTDLYNVHVNLDTMLLHRRGSKLPHRILNTLYYSSDDRIPEVLPPVDLRTWNPEGKLPCPPTVTPEDTKDFDPAIHVPPIAYQHLQWDGYAMRWLSGTNRRGNWKQGAPLIGGSVQIDSPFRGHYEKDEHAEEVETWKQKYGSRYTGYTLTNGELLEDLTPYIVYPQE
jgi:hypothetical protein